MYLDAYLEACAAYGWSGGPEFKTRIVPLANGREQRNADWQHGRHRYTLPFMNISRESYRGVRQMFEVCRGMLHCFRYRDPLDHEADNEIIGYGDGVQTTWQLTKASTIDGVTYLRDVFAIPTLGEFTLTVGDVVVAPADYELNRETGMVTFDTAPEEFAIIRWSTPAFDVWVRFDTDWLPFSIDNLNAHNGSFDLLEVPPPEA